MTTFSIGRRTDVDGGAGSGFAMMISHGSWVMGHGQRGVVEVVVQGHPELCLYVLNG